MVIFKSKFYNYTNNVVRFLVSLLHIIKIMRRLVSVCCKLIITRGQPLPENLNFYLSALFFKITCLKNWNKFSLRFVGKLIAKMPSYVFTDNSLQTIKKIMFYK